MTECKCNHCGEEASINIALADSIFHHIEGKTYCSDCFCKFVSYYIDESCL